MIVKGRVNEVQTFSFNDNCYYIDPSNFAMKLRSLLLPIALIISINTLHAQHVNMSADSVTKILCRQWKLNILSMPDGQQMSPPPGMDLEFGFKSDHTYTITPANPGEKKDPSEKHTWNFDPKKKSIELKLNGEIESEIISLSDDELTVIIHVKNNKAAPQDIEGTKMVLIPKN